jgi:uncharacterized protein (TIGR00369 family)
LSSPEHFRKLERLYLAARCNAYYAPGITISEGTCEVRIAIREDFFHAAGATHGSVYFKALDDAAFFAANSLVAGVLVLTTTFHVSFLRPISRGEMRAVGTVVHPGAQLVFAESSIEDSDGRLIARGHGSFLRSRIPLTPEMGYL